VFDDSRNAREAEAEAEADRAAAEETTGEVNEVNKVT
jgi:hypothetical protein